MIRVGWVEKRLHYNHLMRYAIVLCCLFAAACAPQSVDTTPDVGNLRPYQTTTPSPTISTPEGLVVSVQTPLPTPTPFIYTIAAGDTLSQIAEKLHVSLDALMAANPTVDPNALPVGHTILVPSNPLNLTGEGTPTPVPFPVQQIACHPTADRGMGCFVLIHNDSTSYIENVAAQVTLMDSNGKSIASQTALMPLDILAPDTSMPLTTYFAPDVPSDAKPQVQILSATQILPGDPRYLPAAIQNTLVQVDWSGLSAQVSGKVTLPANSISSHLIWVAATAYDGDGNVIGVRRWESKTGVQPGGSLPFNFMISSVGGTIERVDFAVEARP
jgi:LysM repeat protein